MKWHKYFLRRIERDNKVWSRTCMAFWTCGELISWFINSGLFIICCCISFMFPDPCMPLNIFPIAPLPPSAKNSIYVWKFRIPANDIPANGLELGWLADEEPPDGCDEGWLVGVVDAGVLVSVFGGLDSWKFISIHCKSRAFLAV